MPDEPERPEGREILDSEEVAALESALELDEGDIEARLRLLRHWTTLEVWRKAGRPKVQPCIERLVPWIVRNAPAHEILADGAYRFLTCESEEFITLLTSLWHEQVEARPEDPRVLGNAGAYFSGRDWAESVRLYERAHALQPEEPHWALGLADALQFPEIHSDEEQVAMARRRLSLFEVGRAHVAGDPGVEVHTVLEMSECAYLFGALDRAASRAEEALDLRVSTGKGALFRHAITHRASMVLGMIALKRGEVEEAERRLLAAVRVAEEGPVFGEYPDMSLVCELLERGRRSAVLEYLGRCAQHWRTSECESAGSDSRARLRQRQLERDQDEVRRGLIPEWLFPCRLLPWSRQITSESFPGRADLKPPDFWRPSD